MLKFLKILMLLIFLIYLELIKVRKRYVVALQRSFGISERALKRNNVPRARYVVALQRTTYLEQGM
ncbi:MAG: hypothetical protein EAZ33_22525 [Oscillatoriales cyanobacterium]|nr:MAG: hypothetical protein EAZ33_22525 [Oscillatoriales cyanobacterium]